jgi:hypothetical protein
MAANALLGPQLVFLFLFNMLKLVGRQCDYAVSIIII